MELPSARSMGGFLSHDFPTTPSFLLRHGILVVEREQSHMFIRGVGLRFF